MLRFNWEGAPWIKGYGLLLHIRAILWIHVHAACKSEDVSPQFPRPAIRYTSPSTDPDLTHLLEVCHRQDEDIFLADLYCIRPASTPAHIQWASNAMLHFSWAKRGEANAFESIGEYWLEADWGTIPLNAALDRLLASCIFFGQPIEEEVLKIQDKSYAVFCILLTQATCANSLPVFIRNKSSLGFPRS